MTYSNTAIGTGVPMNLVLDVPGFGGAGVDTASMTGDSYFCLAIRLSSIIQNAAAVAVQPDTRKDTGFQERTGQPR